MSNSHGPLLGMLIMIVLGTVAQAFTPMVPVPHDETPAEMVVDSVAVASVGKAYPAYRPGYVVVADVLRDVAYPGVADSAQVAEIERELIKTGRTLPDLWRDALSHPIGVQALKQDIAASVIWVARCMWTETNRPEEFLQVGWVIRGRYETKYRGEDEYRTVILDRSQFSYFNSEAGRARMEATGYHSNKRNFQKALEMAFWVITAPESARPFPANTLHYYSTVSMKPSYSTYCWRRHTAAQLRTLGKAHPTWAHQGHLASTGPNPDRFRFIAGAP